MIENIKNDTSMGMSNEKKETMIVMGTALLNAGYEPAFVAGVLGNVLAEGNVGQFENSNYSSHPEMKKNYLKYVDEHHNYATVFSNKNLSEVGIRITLEMLNELPSGTVAGFGLGCAQWTFGRTKKLIQSYKDVVGIDGFPTLEQCQKIESDYLVKELKEDYDYVYQDWLSQYKGKDDAAYHAGRIVTLKFEVPADAVYKSGLRGNSAREIYNVFMRTN